jgi:hypothetical protein
MLPFLPTLYMAVPWLKEFVTDLLPQRPGFDPRLVHVGFVVDEVALGQVFLKVFPCHCHSTTPYLIHLPFTLCNLRN